MKKQFRLVSLFLCVALIVSVIPGLGMVINAAEKNLLSNAEFESFNAEKNSFDGWTFYATGNNTRTISQTDGMSGEKAALIISTDNESMASVYQQFAVETGKSYRVSVWLKAIGDDFNVFNAAGWGEGIRLKIYSDDKSIDLASEGIKSEMSWRKISYIVDADTIPDNVTKLTFEVLMHAVCGRLYIDGASVTEYNGEEEEPQYLYNNGFEDYNSSTIFDWSQSGRTDIFAAEISKETAYEGTNSLFYNSTDRNAVVNTYQSVKGLNSAYRYLFSGYAKASTVSAQYGGAGLRLGIEYTDSVGGVHNLWSADSFQQATDWTQITLCFTIPEGATDVKAYVQSNCIEGAYYVDALDIMAIGRVDSFANGSFEAFDGQNFPCWTWYPGNGDAGQNTLTQNDLGYEGKAAVISKSFLDNAANLKQTLDFNVDAEKNYIVSAYVRATYSEDAPWDMKDWGWAKLIVSDGNNRLESESIRDIGPWKKLSVIVNASQLSSDSNWSAEFDMYGMTGVVYIDNVSISEYTGSQDNEVYEPLYNIGFEEGVGTTFDYWRTTGTEITVISGSADARTGERALSFYSDNINAVNKVYQPLYAFETEIHYLLSAYVKTVGALETAYDGGGVKLEVRYNDAQGVECAVMSSNLKLAEDWSKIRVPFSIPEGATNVTVSVMVDCVKGTALIDDLDIVELSVGDVNYDGTFNAADIVRLKKYVAQTTQDIYMSFSDLDSNNEINITDVTILRDGILNGGLVNENLEVWTVDSLTRVSKDSASNGEITVSLFAAKGEYEAFQLVTATDGEKKTILNNISVSDFVNASGEVIESSENVTVYREHYVTCSIASPSSPNVNKDSVGEIPDALIPAVSPVTGESLGNTSRFFAFPHTLSNNECQPFYIDVKIPADASAGDYTATYTVYTNNGFKKGKINLKVWNITLNQTQVQGSYFLSRTAKTALKVEEAAKNRMFINAVSAEQETVLNTKYGYNNVNLGFWSGADNKNPVMKDAPEESAIQSKISLHNSNLKIFNYTADEIDKYVDVLKDGIINYSKVLHKYNVKQLITISPVAELMDDGSGNPAVDIWTVLPKSYVENEDMIATAREKGCEIWTYNCLAQDKYSPKFLLDYPLINYRIHPGFINYSLGVDGFLYWSIDDYEGLLDPWTSLSDATEGTVYNGDGILFYPGEDVGLTDTFVPSLRAKAIRDGFEDYELCAAANISADSTSQIAASFKQWTQDKNDLLGGRIELGNGIAQ